jgi:hypothetical protein
MSLDTRRTCLLAMAITRSPTFLTDGGEDIRDLPCYLNAQAEHLLDWFHLMMRITVMANIAKSLRPPPDRSPRTSRRATSPTRSARSWGG